jgi:hypothetical protein
MNLDLANCILYNEVIGENFSQELFEEYKDGWLQIRENNEIKQNIETLIKCAKNMKRFKGLFNVLTINKNRLIEKYYITHWDLEEHSRILEKEGVTHPSIDYTVHGEKYPEDN